MRVSENRMSYDNEKKHKYVNNLKTANNTEDAHISLQFHF